MAKNKGQGLCVGVAESRRREHLIRPEEGNGGKYVDVWGRTFQTERRANVKALGWEQPSVFTEQTEASMAE